MLRFSPGDWRKKAKYGYPAQLYFDIMKPAKHTMIRNFNVKVKGAREVKVDYSEDGTHWTWAATMVCIHDQLYNPEKFCGCFFGGFYAVFPQHVLILQGAYPGRIPGAHIQRSPKVTSLARNICMILGLHVHDAYRTQILREYNINLRIHAGCALHLRIRRKC
jgi:hypothetical protein